MTSRPEGVKAWTFLISLATCPVGSCGFEMQMRPKGQRLGKAEHSSQRQGTAAASTDLGFRSVHRLLLKVGALGQHSSVVLVADVLI